MNRPTVPPDHQDRLLDCQEQMEDAFIELVDRAKASGWSHREALIALGHLALHHVEALAANANTDRQIAAAMALQPTKH